MTKKLTELLNLPTFEEETKHEISEHQYTIENIDDAIDKIDEALPMVKDLDAGDKELDELSDLAKDTFNTLIDLSMNVDPRFSGPILQSASTLLGHAISAKTAKMDKKIKMVQLQLQKAKLDQQSKPKEQHEDENGNVIDGKGIVMDRNALLEQILGKQKPQ